MGKYDLDISVVLLRIMSLTLKCVPEETRTPPFSATDFSPCCSDSV